MSASIIARLDDVTHRYGSTLALDHVALEIPASCMVGMIGPDGVGKSTLLALISGVRKIQAGRVTVFDGDMANPLWRRVSCGRIAYMPQGLGRNLYPTLSVFENIDFFGRLFGQPMSERHDRIDSLLKATHLDPFVDRPAGKLSGGMKQKLSLCCALMHDPDLVVLDEPTTGVDPLSRGQFWELIDSIRARHLQMSVVVATAYMDEAERFDWLAAMDDGSIIARGTPQEILNQTQEQTLEAAFIALLPPEKRAQHQKVIQRPRRASADETPAIEAEGLTRRFGEFVAVDHVSFRIGRGEIFGFLGSNGCGKTTTMKMLTGLLAPSEGSAKLFGKPIGADTFEQRRNVGYMSQAFSLYTELTVRQNLDLHARLYHLPTQTIASRIDELLARYDLKDVADARPDSLPLGIKQRLQLAVAVLHRPALLILDEPTSGVDPIARDAFWHTLIDLSRDDGVTIFLSTHFMNEAERCDRISLMHAGKVLAVGSPGELAAVRGMGSLEDAFIAALAEAEGEGGVPGNAGEAGQRDGNEPLMPAALPTGNASATNTKRFNAGRLWAHTRREAMELLRDPIRLGFALLGPLILMLAFGYGISFDVENLKYAAFDQDRTPESRMLLESFSGSRYFSERPPITSPSEMEARFKSGELALVIEIPPGFGRELQSAQTPEVGVWIDGAMPFRGETTRSYVSALALQYVKQRLMERSGPNTVNSGLNIETRFRYNQSFKSVNAMVPGVIVLMLILIPAVMSAVAVVREKETGSIANFRATPTSKIEFLLGKQLPYVAIAMVSFIVLIIVAIFVFDVPVKGSPVLLVFGTLLYVFATTGFGQLVSTVTRTQVAAVFATAIFAIVPSVNFSGLLVPVSSLSGGGRLLGLSFPAAWYQPIAVAAFAKALGLSELWFNMFVLACFTLFYLIAAQFLLRKQEV